MARKVNFTKNESKEVKKFIIILIIMTFSIGLIYLFTGLFVAKDLKKDKTDNKVTIDYNLTLIGNISDINREEFYVMIYDYTSEKAEEINNIIEGYKTSENYKYIYKANLNDSLNKQFISDETNVSDINNLKINGLTLLHIKDKTVIDYKNNIDDIKNELEN